MWKIVGYRFGGELHWYRGPKLREGIADNDIVLSDGRALLHHRNRYHLGPLDVTEDYREFVRNKTGIDLRLVIRGEK